MLYASELSSGSGNLPANVIHIYIAQSFYLLYVCIGYMFLIGWLDPILIETFSAVRCIPIRFTYRRIYLLFCILSNSFCSAVFSGLGPSPCKILCGFCLAIFAVQTPKHGVVLLSTVCYCWLWKIYSHLRSQFCYNVYLHRRFERSAPLQREHFFYYFQVLWVRLACTVSYSAAWQWLLRLLLFILKVNEWMWPFSKLRYGRLHKPLETLRMSPDDGCNLYMLYPSELSSRPEYVVLANIIRACIHIVSQVYIRMSRM